MKRIIALLTISACLLALNVSAQTFGSGVTVIGTTNAPLVSNGTPSTNTTYLSFPQKTVTLSGILDTNEVAIFSYGVVFAGSTNIVLIGSFTNSFALTNGGIGTGTWSTNIPQMTIAAQIIPYAQIAIGSHTNTVYVP